VRRYLGELSVMLIEVDRFDELGAKYGDQVASLIIRKLAKILGTKVRKEDTVAQLAECRFCVVTPSINIDSCSCTMTSRRRDASRAWQTLTRPCPAGRRSALGGGD
jgi:diguanylate cyclase (GGDEF)-like protein